MKKFCAQTQKESYGFKKLGGYINYMDFFSGIICYAFFLGFEFLFLEVLVENSCLSIKKNL